MNTVTHRHTVPRLHLTQTHMRTLTCTLYTLTLIYSISQKHICKVYGVYLNTHEHCHKHARETHSQSTLAKHRHTRIHTTSVRVPRKAKIILCSSKIFFLCKNAFKWAIAQLSNQLGTIFRVRLKFALNHHWNLFFHDANFIFLIQIYGNFKVTLKMVPDWFDSRAMAHLNAFLQRKNIFEEQSLILAFLGTLTDVMWKFVRAN